MGPVLPGKPAQCHLRTWVWWLSPAQTLSPPPGTRRNSSLLLAGHLRPFNGASPVTPPPLKVRPARGPLNTGPHCALVPSIVPCLPFRKA